MTHLWEFKKYLKGLGYYLSEEESEPGEDYIILKHPKTEIGGKYVCLSYFEEGHQVHTIEFHGGILTYNSKDSITLDNDDPKFVNEFKLFAKIWKRPSGELKYFEDLERKYLSCMTYVRSTIAPVLEKYEFELENICLCDSEDNTRSWEFRNYNNLYLSFWMDNLTGELVMSPSDRDNQVNLLGMNKKALEQYIIETAFKSSRSNSGYKPEVEYIFLGKDRDSLRREYEVCDIFRSCTLTPMQFEEFKEEEYVRERAIYRQKWINKELSGK